MTKFDQFLDAYEKYANENCPPQRYGQALMNCLAGFDRDEYNKISSVHFYERSDIDCFYRDELIDNTLRHLKLIWK